jgi:hypothetical protein
VTSARSAGAVDPPVGLRLTAGGAAHDTPRVRRPALIGPLVAPAGPRAIDPLARRGPGQDRRGDLRSRVIGDPADGEELMGGDARWSD